jgi:hypothetical protein
MIKYSFIHTLNRNDHDDLEVEVTFEYTPGSKGERDSRGLQVEPDDMGWTEIISITKDGEPFVTTDDEDKEIEVACWNNIEEPL